MLNILLMAFLISPDTPMISVPSDVLVDYDLHKTRYGFVHDNHMYITYLHVIAKIDMGGNLIADYRKKGQGPGERMGGPMFRFGDEIWCKGVMTRKMLILDANLNFQREIPIKFPTPHGSSSKFAPGESSIYVLTLKGVQEKQPFFHIQQRSPDNLSLEKEFELDSIPLHKRPTMGTFIGINYLGDNQFAVYQTFQIEKEYTWYLWDSKTNKTQPFTHLTPQLPPANAMKQLLPNLLGNGASSLEQVNPTSSGYTVFFEASEIDPNKDRRDRDWYLFTHQFGNDQKPSKATQDTAFVLVSRGLTDATLIRHPDLGIEVLDL